MVMRMWESDGWELEASEVYSICTPSVGGSLEWILEFRTRTRDEGEKPTFTIFISTACGVTGLCLDLLR